MESVQVFFKRIRREKNVRRLQHGEFFVAQKPAHAHLQKRARRNVIAIEDGDVLAIGHSQSLIEVAGLGVVVVVARQVTNAQLGAEVAKVVAFAIVQHIHAQTLGGPVQSHGRKDCLLHHAQGLVVGGNENIDAGPGVGVFRQRYRLALQRPGGLKIANQKHRECVQLGHHQTEAKCRIQQVLKTHRVRQSPVDIPRRRCDRQDEHGQGGEPSRRLAQQQGEKKGESRKQQLFLQLHRHADHQRKQQARNDCKQQFDHRVLQPVLAGQ